MAKEKEINIFVPTEIAKACGTCESYQIEGESVGNCKAHKTPKKIFDKLTKEDKKLETSKWLWTTDFSVCGKWKLDKARRYY